MTWIVARAVHNCLPKKDAEYVFIPESNLVMDALEAAGKTYQTVDVDNRLPLPRRADDLYDAITKVDWLEGLVYVGHGLWNLLPSLGLGLGRIPRFASLLAAAAGSTPLTVALLACSAADGSKKGVGTDGPGMDGGFADCLRDALCRLGVVDCRVLAHTTSGHATMNLDLAYFEGLGSSVGGVGGRLLVPAKSPLRKFWKKAMHVPLKKGVSLRHRLCLMRPDEVIREVSGH